MKRILSYSLTLLLVFVIIQCDEQQAKQHSSSTEPAALTDKTKNSVVQKLIEQFGEAERFRAETGVRQTAALWRNNDGSSDEFEAFCLENFVPAGKKQDRLFERLSFYTEAIRGNFNKLSLQLKEPLYLDWGELIPVDQVYAGYDPASNLNEDFYANKIAFVFTLNFPFYSLAEKTELGKDWTRKEWAFTRMGDMYTSRVPANLIQDLAMSSTNANAYISSYNIYMGNLINANGETLFPEDLRLITHWGLRDELKANYKTENGIEKQKMIYQVMNRIIDQSIPIEIIDNETYQWDPVQNMVYEDGTKVEFKTENDRRYDFWLKNFKATKAIDPYHPHYKNYVQRRFENGMEIPAEDIEQMFIEFISSPVVRDVGEFVKDLLGRDLEPFDIWYNGFKPSSGLSEEKLNEITRDKYPSTTAFEKDMPRILTAIGFTPEKANEIAAMVQVDAARGVGHAWGADMRSEKAHLRTRVGLEGMDYKGYNIAIHEFGHNVEQTISLQDVDYYMLNGVPNTAFTEALAFLFQKRDLELLGVSLDDPDAKRMLALANCWSTYEIMGVSLVDMYAWKWLYKNPDATAGEFKNAVIKIAKDVWNDYYADVFGVRDIPLLAVYSHMIYRTIYLPAYPVGHLIDFQLENHMEGNNLAEEVMRIFTAGSIIPQLWMEHAVGTGISGQATLDAAKEAL